MSKTTAITATAIALIVGCILGLRLAGRPAAHHTNAAPPDANVERYRIPVDGAPQRGNATAKVTLVEFSDFECPFCSRVEPVLAEVMARYGRDVRLVWKDFPLPQHRDAVPAAIAARAAARQGRFWPLHDRLFANQRTLDRESLIKHARAVGVDLTGAFDDASLAASVRSDADDARRFAVNATPSFYLNGRPVRGPLTAAALAPMIEEELANADRALAAGTAPRDLYAALTAQARTSGAPAAAAPARVDIPVGDSAVRGGADAKVTIVEFSDFECPACGRAEPTVRALQQQLGAAVRLVWKQLPLAMHAHARLAAEASLAAGAQGKFWEMHDRLFADQQHLDRDSLERHAAALHLDKVRFRRALDQHTYAPIIDSDGALAARLGVSGTPTFFVDGQRITNWTTELTTTASQALARAQAASRPRPGRPDPTTIYRALVGDAPARGGRAPKVTIVEWADFECPYCARMHDALTAVVDAHGEDVQLVFKQLPLPNHAHAHLAAEAALAAQAQGKFWELERALFAHQDALDRAALDRYAAAIGLDTARFAADLDGHRYAAAVDAQAAEGQRLGVQATPSFFIDGRFFEGADSAVELGRKVDAALAAAEARLAAGTPRARLYDALMKTARSRVEAPALIDEAVRAVDPGPAAPSRGRRQAPVTVVEFSDFECPYCRRAAAMVEEVRTKYGDAVRVVFRNFPLPYHKSAHLAAEAALAAHAQGKFWEMHDRLFAHQTALDRATIDGFARELGLDLARFDAALDAGTFGAAVNADLLAGGPFVEGTPTLFVNGHKLVNPGLLAQVVGETLRRQPK